MGVTPPVPGAGAFTRRRPDLCGAGGPMSAERWAKAERARALRDAGLTHRQVAATMGFSRPYVRALLSDPTGEKAASRRHTATCDLCDRPIRKEAGGRCGACKHGPVRTANKRCACGSIMGPTARTCRDCFETRNNDLVKRAKEMRRAGKSAVEIGQSLGVNAAAITRWLNPGIEVRQRRIRAAGRKVVNGRDAARSVRDSGGVVPEAYSLVRRAKQVLGGDQRGDRGRRSHLDDAHRGLSIAEDALVAASKGAPK